MMLRALGHIPDLDEHVEDDLRSRHVGSLVGAASPDLPREIDYLPLVDHVPDQGGNEACVGFAFASAIYLRAKIAGTPIERPSAKGIWDLARLVDTPNRLENVGTRPRAAIEGMTDFGISAEARWPSDENRANVLPPADVFRAGCGAMLGGHYRIGNGQGSSLLVQIALSKGFVVPFAMPVDDAYVAHREATTYRGLQGPMRGRHMQVVIGYGVENGRLFFRVLNSWGVGWGWGGFAKIDAEFFETGLTTDMLVPTIIPLNVT